MKFIFRSMPWKRTKWRLVLWFLLLFSFYYPIIVFFKFSFEMNRSAHKGEYFALCASMQCTHSVHQFKRRIVHTIPNENACMHHEFQWVLMIVGWFYDYCVKFHSLRPMKWKKNNTSTERILFSPYFFVWSLEFEFNSNNNQYNAG